MKLSKNVFVLAVLLVMLSSQAFCAELLVDRVANFASDSVSPVVLGAELALWADGPNGRRQATQGARALLATTLIVHTLKYTIREKRPDSESLTSFPSGHTAEAFAMATVWSAYHPKSSWLAYSGAALVGWSRVQKRDHYWKDVIAGAVLGHVIAKKFTSGNFGLSADGSVGYHSRW